MTARILGGKPLAETIRDDVAGDVTGASFARIILPPNIRPIYVESIPLNDGVLTDAFRMAAVSWWRPGQRAQSKRRDQSEEP